MKKIIYLTIDDSPSADFVQKVQFLQTHRIPAVFFCRGDLLARQVPLAVWALQQGAVLANHSFSHPHFSSLSVAACQAEIVQTDQVLQRIYDQAGRPWEHKYFRFPYGDQGDLKYGHLLQPYTAIPRLTARWRNRWLYWLLATVQPARYAALISHLAAVGEARKHQIQQCLAELGYCRPDFSPSVQYHYLHDYVGYDWPWTFDALEWATTNPRPPGGIGTLTQVLARLDQCNPPDLRGPVPEAIYGLPVATSADIMLLHDHEDTSPLFYAIIRHLLTLGVAFGHMPGLGVRP